MTKPHDTQVPGEHFFADLLDQIGGVEALREGADEFHQAVTRMWTERDSLVERHPQKWVAMSKDGVVSVGDSIEEVLFVVEDRNISSSEVVVEYLDPNPSTLIL